MRKFLFIILLCLLPAMAAAQDLIPKPVSVEYGKGEFTIKKQIKIYCSQEAGPAAEYLLDKISNAIPLKKRSITARSGFRGGRGDIQLYTDPAMDLPTEGYRLTVTPRNIIIVGKDYGGVFNGIQTLLQLFPSLVYDNTGWYDTSISAPCVEVEDWPRFGYRGMHLDISRTFSDKKEVLKYIESMAYHKINKFHWHLTDDEGWRVEIKSRPELAEIGGFRGGDSPVFPIYGAWDRKYGGYFTHEDIREVVEFARVRNIEIIPEIDLPGHSRTAGKVYPHILCDGPKDTAHSAGYDMRDVWCASKEENYAILEDVLREISELFPSRYIHIGGDEVNMNQWSRCPLCQATMKKEGLSTGHELEGYFMARLEKILEKYGKSAVVWNEAIIGGKLSESTVVQGWESVDACKKAASAGYKTIVMPGKYFYLDMKYTPQEPGMTWAGIVSTDTVYSFRFQELGFTPQQMENVVGVQGTFFSEIYLDHDRNYVYRMVYPRLCALAEVGWTPEENREWDEFNSRLENTHFGRLERMNIDYRKSPKPVPEVKLLRPALSVSSSMDARDSNPFTNLTTYKYGTTTRTTRTCVENDFILFEFDKPVDCDRIEFVSGYSYLRRCIIPFGYVEVKYAGDKEFSRYGDMHNGKTVIKSGKPIKAFRIVSTSKMNGDSSVIIQPLRVVAKEF